VELLKDSSENMANKYIVPVDQSEHSKRAVNYAYSLCKKLDGEIIIVNVQPNYTFSPNVHRVISKKDIEKYVEELGKEVIELTLKDSQGQELITEKIVLTGEPKIEITKIAKEKGAEAIVMGSRGLGPVKSAVLGSVSVGVLQLAPCPVIIVP
jgi:nucleotide-binding universal stress UspA family protein